MSDARLEAEDFFYSGFGNLPRLAAIGSTATITSGNVYITYFTPRRSRVVRSVGTYSGGTAAAATPTTCRMGLYSIDTQGNGTLIARTANDTTIWNAVNSAFVRNLDREIMLEQDAKYATAVICVSSVAVPSVAAFIGASGIILSRDPRISGVITAQTDLPSSFTAAQPAANSRAYYMDMFSELASGVVNLLEL